MGSDKAALTFEGQTLLERAVGIVSKVTGNVIVVARADQSSGSTFAGLPARIVHDSIDYLGPLAGLAAGLGASTTDLNLVVACDMPLIKPEVLQRLLDLRENADICVAVVEGQPSPLCAAYRASVGGVATAMLNAGERRVMALLDRVLTKRVDAAAFRDIDPNLDSFISCDTPEEFSAALKCRPSGT